MADVAVDSGVTDEAHPEVFDTRAMLPQPQQKKPGQLPDHLIKQFFEEGYLLIPDFFTPAELEVCRQTTAELVEELAQKLYKAGKIPELFDNYDLFQRLIKIEEAFPGANVILHKVPNMPAGYRALWANERLLNLVEQLIGPDIAGSSVWNLRTKTPQNEATVVPWHQDNGYLDNDSYKTFIPSAWIPLLDATEENGCMQFAARGHRTGKIGVHQCCWGGTWYVQMEEEEMEKKLGVDMKKDIKTIPVPYGGLILFSNIIPHRSLPNVSNVIRWSLDLRWQRPQDPDSLWGLKKPVLMRTSKDPNYNIDWEAFDAVSRHEQQKATVADKLSEMEDLNEDPEFDTTLPGPWMKKWEIVHMNKHTEQFRKSTERTSA